MTFAGGKELVSRRYSAVASHALLMRGKSPSSSRRSSPGRRGREECTVLATAKLLSQNPLGLGCIFTRATNKPALLISVTGVSVQLFWTCSTVQKGFTILQVSFIPGLGPLWIESMSGNCWLWLRRGVVYSKVGLLLVIFLISWVSFLVGLCADWTFLGYYWNSTALCSSCNGESGLGILHFQEKSWPFQKKMLLSLSNSMSFA